MSENPFDEIVGMQIFTIDEEKSDSPFEVVTVAFKVAASRECINALEEYMKINLLCYWRSEEE